MSAGDEYRAIYRTLWRATERHDRRWHPRPANDNDWRGAA